MILAAIGGLHWQVFSMTERLSAEIADLNERLSGRIAEISERLARDETDLEYIAPGSAGPASEQAPGD